AEVDGLALDTRGARRLYAATDTGVYTLGLSAARVVPDNGATEGGTLVVLLGQGFTASTRVTVGGVPVTEQTLFDDGTLRFRTGAHAAGTVDVVATGEN